MRSKYRYGFTLGELAAVIATFFFLGCAVGIASGSLETPFRNIERYLLRRNRTTMKSFRELKAERTVPLGELYERGEIYFEGTDLTYSATQRCSCGAGLARVFVSDPTMQFWHCSLCLQGLTASICGEGKSGYLWHGPPIPVSNYTVLMERLEETTRPDARFEHYTVRVDGVALEVFPDEAAAKDALFAIAKRGQPVVLFTEERIVNPTSPGNPYGLKPPACNGLPEGVTT